MLRLLTGKTFNRRPKTVLHYRNFSNFNTNNVLKYGSDTLKVVNNLKDSIELDSMIDKMVDESIENSTKIFDKYNTKDGNKLDIKLIFNLGPVSIEVSQKKN